MTFIFVYIQQIIIMKSNIALIGFMGTGKTTIGKKLASVLKKNFLEMDRIIEQRARCTIPELFAESKELFRKYETQLCKDFYLYENYVISCGGGVILNPENVKILQKVA
ncbi:MAG: shikimate kinase, partial [Promethearchaeota archaeon]